MEKIDNSLEDDIINILQDITKCYWGQIHKYVKKNPKLINKITGFLLKPEKLIVYVGKTHLAIEYIGSEKIDELPRSSSDLELQIYDYTLSENSFLEDIIGFKYNSTSNIAIPLSPFSIDLVLPTNKGFDRLMELNWNLDAQNMFLAFNSPAPILIEDQFTRIINGLFFDSNENGLITRHIKWIDFIPLKYNDIDENTANISINATYYYKKLVENDAEFIYPLPNEYKLKKLPQINRFIELLANYNVKETDITKFLSQDENKFILTMQFGAKNIFPELLCEWQSENKENIKPDFFILQANGYANILEFKLPKLKSKSIVGKSNRELFSAEINSFIAQTRVYETYFEDPNNRKWFENKYHFKVNKPKRIIVSGRRSDFISDEFREIQADFRSIELLTFDDLIDGIIAQFYI